jgi:hypothetical protein
MRNHKNEERALLLRVDAVKKMHKATGLPITNSAGLASYTFSAGPYQPYQLVNWGASAGYSTWAPQPRPSAISCARDSGRT